MKGGEAKKSRLIEYDQLKNDETVQLDNLQKPDNGGYIEGSPGIDGGGKIRKTCARRCITHPMSICCICVILPIIIFFIYLGVVMQEPTFDMGDVSKIENQKTFPDLHADIVLKLHVDNPNPIALVVKGLKSHISFYHPIKNNENEDHSTTPIGELHEIPSFTVASHSAGDYDAFIEIDHHFSPIEYAKFLREVKSDCNSENGKPGKLHFQIELYSGSLNLLWFEFKIPHETRIIAHKCAEGDSLTDILLPSRGGEHPRFPHDRNNGDRPHIRPHGGG